MPLASPVIAQQVQYTSSGSDVTSIALNYGDLTTINSGDLLLIICGDDTDNSGGTPQFDALTGWTKKGEAGDSSSDCQIAVYYKWATGAESGSFNLSHTTTAAALWVDLIRITGAIGSGDPFSNIAWSTPESATTCSTTTGTATQDYCLYMVAMAFDGGDAVLGYNSGDTFTLLTQNYSGTGALDATGRIGYRLGTTATSYTHVWSQEGANEGHVGVGFSILRDPNVYVTSGVDNLALAKLNTIINNKTEVTSNSDAITISKVDSVFQFIFPIESDSDSIVFTELNTGVNDKTNVFSGFDTIALASFNTDTRTRIKSIEAGYDSISISPVNTDINTKKEVTSGVDTISFTSLESLVKAPNVLFSNVRNIQFTTFDSVALILYEGIFEIDGQIEFNGAWTVQEV